MKKLFLMLALAFPMLLTFSSCSTDNNDPAQEEYSFYVNFSQISQDLRDYFDMTVTCTTSTGIMQRIEFTDQQPIPGDHFYWSRVSASPGTFNVKVELKPKQMRTMADNDDYKVQIYAEYAVMHQQNYLINGDEMFSVANSGSQWKTKGKDGFFTILNATLTPVQ